MGTFLGVRTEFNPFWDDPLHYEHMSNKERLYHCGYQDGYDAGSEYAETLKELKQENESLRSLIGANVRVLKAEIKRELEEEIPKP